MPKHPDTAERSRSFVHSSVWPLTEIGSGVGGGGQGSSSYLFKLHFICSTSLLIFQLFSTPLIPCFLLPFFLSLSSPFHPPPPFLPFLPLSTSLAPLVFLCPPLISISLPARYFLLFLPGLLRHFLLVSPCPSFVPSVVLLPFLFFVFINSRQTRRIFSTLMLPCDVTFASSVFSVDSANPDEGRKLLPLLPCRRRTMVITPL